MGEVYRARDTKLKREVAIKILPDEFSRDADRVSRFQREAEVLASLNHPNIATIHNLEEANGSQYLVLELVEGETLAERIRRGPLPVDEALSIPKSICEALEAAHDRGIIHRDLKPANVKITPQGLVKVLDFGLAKLLDGDAATPNSGRGYSPVLSNSPTISPEMTAAGVILGTVAYMSPEQAKGRPADKRSDVWAFGCVMYEMLTGRPLFAAETTSEIVAAVLREEPDLTRVPDKTRRLLQVCLQKDPKQRLQAIGDWRLLLEDAPSASPEAKSWAPWSVAVVCAIVAALAVWAPWRRSPPEMTQAEIHLDLDLGTPVASTNLGADVILSPDGTRLVVVAQGSDGNARLLTRRLDQAQPVELRDTEGAYAPFFSPDGQSVAFFAGGKLKKIALEGGGPVILCDAPAGRGGSWGDDGNLVASLDTQLGLFLIPSTGGKPVPLTTLAAGENSHRWPQILPGGKAVLFTSNTTYANYDEADISVLSVRDHKSKTVLKQAGVYPRYLSSGHLIYVTKGTLFAVRFDLSTLEVHGRAVPLLEDVSNDTRYGFSRVAFSANGTLLYRRGRTTGLSSLYWMDTTGKTEPLYVVEPALYLSPRISPDGGKLIWIVSQGPIADLWIYDWMRGSKTRLTDGKDVYSNPVWSPDGKYIFFSSSEGIRWTRADGAGKPQSLTTSKALQFPNSFTPDGRLVFAEITPAGGLIRTIPVDGSSGQMRAGTPESFLQTAAALPYPAFSPDGRWLAYADAESGTYEVYVRAFPDKGTRWPISSGGGTMPVWSRNGHELFYRTEDSRHIMVASYKVTGDSFDAEKPRSWSEKPLENTGLTSNYDLDPNGKRFAVLMPAEGPESPTVQSHVMLITNFFDELRRRVPVESR
jgi:serine/threonine-protein kinase